MSSKNSITFYIVLVVGKRNEPKLYTLRRSKNARNVMFLAFRDFKT